MIISKENLYALSRGAHDSGKDIFLVTGCCETLPEIIDMLSFNDEKLLILLPGKFSLPENLFFGSDISVLTSTSVFGMRENLNARIYIADVRMLADEACREFLRDRKVMHIAVTFAELAFMAEYGHCSAYGWVGEFRAELPYATRVTALFSCKLDDYSVFSDAFGVAQCVVADIADRFRVDVKFADSKSMKYSFVADLIANTSGRIAVIFTDRREAEEFTGIMKKDCIEPFYIDGSISDSEKSDIMKRFMSERSVLIGTKSVIAFSLLCKADKVVYCGVPYSEAFAARCAAFSESNSLTCCFCHSDLQTDINIIKYFAEAVPDNEKEKFITEYLERLLKMKNFLYGSV